MVEELQEGKQRKLLTKETIRWEIDDAVGAGIVVGEGRTSGENNREQLMRICVSEWLLSVWMSE